MPLVLSGNFMRMCRNRCLLPCTNILGVGCRQELCSTLMAKTLKPSSPIPRLLTRRLRARLPPITQRRDGSTPANAFLNRGFAFQAPAWQRCQLRQVLLTKVFRQSSQSFIGILNEIRHASRTNMEEKKKLLSGACHKTHTPRPSPTMFRKLNDIGSLRVLHAHNLR